MQGLLKIFRIFIMATIIVVFCIPLASAQDINAAIRNNDNNHIKTLKEKTAYKKQAEKALKEYKEALKDFYRGSQVSSIEIIDTQVWDYYKKAFQIRIDDKKDTAGNSFEELDEQKSLAASISKAFEEKEKDEKAEDKTGDEKAQEETKIDPQKQFNQDMKQVHSDVTNDKSLIFNYLGIILDDYKWDYHKKEIEWAIEHPKEEYYQVWGKTDKMLDSFKLLTDQLENTEDLIDEIFDGIINKSFWSSFEDDIVALENAKTDLLDIPSFRKARLQIAYTLISYRIGELKIASQYGYEPFLPHMLEREKTYFSKLREKRVEQIFFMKSLGNFLNDNERNLYKEIESNFNKALSVYWDYTKYEDSLDQRTRDFLEQIRYANFLLRMQTKGYSGDNSRMYFNDCGKIMYQAKRQEYMTDSGQEIEDSFADDEEKINTDSFEAKICAGEILQKGHIAYYVYLKFKRAETIYNEQEKVRQTLDSESEKYLSPIIIAKDNIKKERSTGKKELEKNTKDTSFLVYEYFRRTLLNKGLAKAIVKIGNSDAPASTLAKIGNSDNTEKALAKGIVSSASESVYPSSVDELAEALMNAKSPTTRVSIINNAKERGIIDAASADTLTYNVNFKNPEDHDFFTCTPETCPGMETYHQDRWGITDWPAAVYYPVYGITWFADEWVIDFIWPYRQTHREMHWQSTHPVDETERKILASVNNQILDTLRDAYNEFLDLVYFEDPLKREIISKKYFKGVDLGDAETNPFFYANTGDLREISPDDGYFETLWNGNMNTLLSSYKKGFKKSYKILGKMTKDRDTHVTDEVQFIIDTVPSRDEVFAMSGYKNPYYSYDKQRTMSYPKVLDNFTEVEKRILFENFMSIYFIDNPEGRDKLIDFMTGVESKFAPMLESRQIDYRTHALATGMYLPMTPINASDTPDKLNAIMNFHDSVMSLEQYEETNRYTKKTILSQKEKENIKSETYLTDEEIERAVNIQLIQQTEQFYTDFYKHFGVEYYEATTSNFISINYFLESEEFLSWWKATYGFEFSSEIYDKLYEHWVRIKMDYVLKLYIQHLLEKAEKWEPDFNLFEYIQARTHLRILTNIVLIRYAFLKLLKPYEYETFRMSDLMLADNIQFGIMWTSILLVLNPALRAGTKALGKYAARPVVRWLVNRTIPDAASARLLAGVGRRLTRINLEPGKTVAEAIEEANAAGVNDWFYRQLVRWGDPNRPMAIKKIPKKEKTKGLVTRTLESVKEVFKVSSSYSQSGSKLPWKDRIRIYKETMAKLKDEPIATIKEKIRLGDREFTLYGINMKWLARFNLKQSKKFRKLMKNNPLFMVQEGASQAEIEKNISKYIKKLLNLDKGILDNIGIVNVRNLPVMLRYVERDGQVLAMDAIPYTEKNLMKFFADHPPGAYVHLTDSRLTVLDLRKITKIKFPTEEMAQDEILSLFAQANIRKAQQTEFVAYVKHYLKSTGRKPDQWTFGEAVAKYLQERAQFEIDAIIVDVNESTILKIVSEELQKKLLRGTPRAYRFLKF